MEPNCSNDEITQFFVATEDRQAWAMARLISSVAHKIGSPLQTIAGALYLADQARDPDEIARYLHQIGAQCSRIKDTLDTALNAMRLPEALAQTQALADQLEAAKRASRVEHWGRRAEFRASSDAAYVRWPEWQQAAVFLIQRALVWIPASDLLEIGVVLDHADASSMLGVPTVRLTVQAPSLDCQRDALEHAREPWFTATSPEQRHAALGWSGLAELLRRRGATVEATRGCWTLCWPTEVELAGGVE